MDPERLERRKDFERRDDVNLTTSVFGESWQEELKKIDKHEIVVKICEIIGPSPENLSLAEEIFEKLKFDIARYIMHHEYSKENGIRSRLLLWLDSKTNPDKTEQLTDFINKYMK